MTRSDRAKQYKIEGFNCAQSVILACADLTGGDEKTLMSASSGFGGGMGVGEVCGAVSGAAMALGMMTAPAQGAGNNQELNARALTKELIKRFRQENEAVSCRELLRKTAPERKCAVYVGQAVEIVESLYDEAARVRFEADKADEWSRMLDEDYEIAHGLQNAGGDYIDWKRMHTCEKYPDHTGRRCAVCESELPNQG